MRRTTARGHVGNGHQAQQANDVAAGWHGSLHLGQAPHLRDGVLKHDLARGVHGSARAELLLHASALGVEPRLQYPTQPGAPFVSVRSRKKKDDTKPRKQNNNATMQHNGAVVRTKSVNLRQTRWLASGTSSPEAASNRHTLAKQVRP